LSTSGQFTAPADYVFSTALGGRITDKRLRSVFYAALVRAGLGHKRQVADRHGNPQEPMTPHDLRHSYCTWAMNVWPVTKVKEYAGRQDDHAIRAPPDEGRGRRARRRYLARALGCPVRLEAAPVASSVPTFWSPSPARRQSRRDPRRSFQTVAWIDAHDAEDGHRPEHRVAPWT
jgi:hypothetical protein